MAELTEWMEAAEAVSEQALQLTGYRAGCVDAYRIAAALGYVVICDRQQDARGRLKQIGGRITIFLRPDERAERLQWALSHEIGETLAHQVFRRCQCAPGDAAPGMREQVANLLAARLLLPRQPFFAAARDCQRDLRTLKQQFATASYELIALRLLDQKAPCCVTIFDQGRMTKRRSNLAQPPGPLQSPEQVCWEQAHHQADYRETEQAGLKVRCWPIHEPHWKREIVLTTPGEIVC